jgi:ectoine hydroxylase-related dioxygenase (phytanoyl-CoA dioxygenase family)
MEIRSDPLKIALTDHDEDLGRLGILHLAEFWARRSGRRCESGEDEHWVADNTLLSGLRLGLRETVGFLHSTTPTLEQFEAWILEKNGGALDPELVRRLNVALSGGCPDAGVHDSGPLPLNGEDLTFWKENGYVVVQDAVSQEQCQAGAQAIYDFLRIDPDQAGTWYGHSIWVPVLHHPAFWANRESPRIRRAFAQLWGRQDLWITVDQGGLNPPERPGWRFSGQGLHFDVSLELPIPFGVQGILYLTDTAANQGAFRCVPGFHRRIDTWLNSLPLGADPRKEDLEKFGAVPIAGRAGDLIIWHHALPHANSPNRATHPRVVQYIRMMPSQWGHNRRWV